MVNLNITVIQGNKDGSDSMISLDVLKREDASDLEYKIVKALEEYMFKMVSELPMLKLGKTRELLREEYNEEKCSVKDLKGNHCPKKVVTYIDRDGKKLPLCRKCYNNVMEESYGC
jgi:hypothetical protein